MPQNGWLNEDRSGWLLIPTFDGQGGSCKSKSRRAAGQKQDCPGGVGRALEESGQQVQQREGELQAGI